MVILYIYSMVIYTMVAYLYSMVIYTMVVYLYSMVIIYSYIHIRVIKYTFEIVKDFVNTTILVN